MIMVNIMIKKIMVLYINNHLKSKVNLKEVGLLLSIKEMK